MLFPSCLVFFLLLTFQNVSDAQPMEFTVSLTEQQSPGDTNNQKNIKLTGNLDCTTEKCETRVEIENDEPDFFRVLMDGKLCTNNVCIGSFKPGQTSNITVSKVNKHLDIFDFAYKTSPYIAVLGCQLGLYVDGTCTQITTSETAIFDRVCVCATTENPYCSEQTSHGVCTSGNINWWQDDALSTLGSTMSTSMTTVTPPFHEEATITLSEEKTNSQGNNKDITVSAQLDCDGIQCSYHATFSNPTADYYKVLIDECFQSPCSGSFKPGQSVAMLVYRLNQHLELLKFEFQKISVLGCNSGLIKAGTCLKSISSPNVAGAYYNDIVCSCQGAQAACNNDLLLGGCTMGSITWWQDDTDSTAATSPTTHSTPILSTSSAPNPYIYDFSILLAEGIEYEPEKQNNITIGAFVNCNESICQYTITNFNPGDTYYALQVNFLYCPAGVCQGLFHRGATVRTTLTRRSEVLDLFDLYFDVNTGLPNVMVLGCSSGLLKHNECQMLDYYDTEVQMHDVACICQSKHMTCDGTTRSGVCESEQPIWWEQYETSFSTLLSQSETNANPNSDKNLSLSTFLQCSETTCSYEIAVDHFKINYYTVQVDGKSCDDSCKSSFLKSNTVPVTIFKENEFLDLMVLSYNSVTVLGCSQGLLEQDKCTKTSHQDDKLSTQLCTCGDGLNDCGVSEPEGKCQDGVPIWWQPIPTIGTTLGPFLQQFSVDFTEKDVIRGNEYSLTVATSVQCAGTYCTYSFTYSNHAPDYYTLFVNGEICVSSPCAGYFSDSQKSVILSVHRFNEHLDLVELQYFNKNEFTFFVMKCQLHDLNTCWTGVKKNILLEGRNLTDSICVCSGAGDNCHDNDDRSSCLTWWSSDQSTTLSTAVSSTASSTFSTPMTTTFYDVRNQFSMDVALTESYKKKTTIDEFLSNAVTQKRHVAVSATMLCAQTDCDYSISVDNSAMDYFKVYVNNQLCPKDVCTGSLLHGKSVNVTVFREGQHLDLMDFEFTDMPRVVVLGCQDGLVKYQGCVKMTQTSSDGVNDYADEVCSCRSAELKCINDQENGICISGNQNWWKNNDVSSTTSFTSTTTIPTTSLPSDGLKHLSDSGVGLNNVTQVLNATLPYSEKGSNLNRTQIFEITKILHNSANLPGISQENAFQILQNLDNVLNAHQEEIRKSQSKEFRLLEILRPMVKNTNGTLIQYLKGMNLGFGAKHVNCKNLNSDDGLIDNGPDHGFEFLNGTNQMDNRNSIVVPLSEICGDQSISHVFFTIYRQQKLFSGPKRYRVYGGSGDQNDNDYSDSDENSDSLELDAQNDSAPFAPPSKCDSQISLPYQSPVMSATVMNNGNSIRALSSDAVSPVMAKLKFNLGKLPRPLHGQTIVSWFNTGIEEWDLGQQCKVISDDDGVLTAHCAHLTDFSALILGQINSQYVCSYPLIVLGYVVNAFSIVCLMMLIVIGTMFYLRGATIRKVLTYIRGQTPVSGDIINLTYYCAFFVFFILLLFFMNQTDESPDSDGGSTSTSCIVIAALSYFSLISAIMLSMLIGIRMISHFFTPKLRTFFGVLTSPAVALSIGLIIPFIFTLCIAIFDTDFFKRNDAFCWVRPDFVVYGVVIPIALPILNGLMCSAFVIYKMFCQTKRGLANKETAHYDAEFWSKIFGLIIMQVAMGLPWGIEFIIIGLVGPSPWNYIFVILIGSQGIDLFLIFLYRRHRLLMDAKKWSARRHRFESDGSKRTQARRAETFMSQTLSYR